MQCTDKHKINHFFDRPTQLEILPKVENNFEIYILKPFFDGKVELSS
jgi:hypothetical protein